MLTLGPQSGMWALAALTLLLATVTDAKVGGDCAINATQVLKTQSDLDSIRADCKKIVGNLDIQCADTDEIANFEVFRMVEEITGYLRVEKCQQVENFELGFQNLKAIHGDELLSIPGLGDGFSMYIVENAKLTTLGGFQNITTIEGVVPGSQQVVAYGPETTGKNESQKGNPSQKGKGRVYIAQNEELCYTTKMDWLTIVGPSWRRAVYEITGQNTNCARKQCHKSCSCDLCSGPSESQCQGMCLGNGSDHDAMVMTTMALMCMVTTILAIFISLYLTDRCGLRLRYFTQLVHFGIEETERHRRTSAVDGFASDLSQMRNQKLDADPFSKDVDPSSQRQGSVVSNESSFGKGLSDGQKDAFTSRKLGSEVLGS